MNRKIKVGLGDSYAANLIDTVYNMRPEERLRMGENARNYMLKEHNIDAIASKYVANILN